MAVTGIRVVPTMWATKITEITDAVATDINIWTASLGAELGAVQYKNNTLLAYDGIDYTIEVVLNDYLIVYDARNSAFIVAHEADFNLRFTALN